MIFTASLIQIFGANEAVTVSVMLHEGESDLKSKVVPTAAVMADKLRSRMLCTLMDGCVWTATKLSMVADIPAPTASAHLTRLCKQHFVVALAQGRHCYLRLTGSDIAKLLERLMGIAWVTSTPCRIITPPDLWHACTCYDHLAEKVAVRLFDTLVPRQWLTPDGEILTLLGQKKLARMGTILATGPSRQKLTCGCLNWSERRYHPGGMLGAMLLCWFSEQR